MTRSADPSAWYTLPSSLDSSVVDALRQRLAEEDPCFCLMVDASRVRRVDAVGALRLWQVCSDFARHSGARVELVHLSPALATRLRRHPLLSLIRPDDSLFADPLDLPADSAR